MSKYIFNLAEQISNIFELGYVTVH